VAIASLGNNRRELWPVAWKGGFAALQSVNGDARTIWLSSDGVAWSDHRLPGRFDSFGLLAFGDRLALGEHHQDASFSRSRVTVWWSSDGRSWERGGTVDAIADTPGYAAGGGLGVLGDRLAVVSYIQPYSCCGGAQPGRPYDDRGSAARPAFHGAAAARDELGMWAWTSTDGVAWTKERMRGLGTDSLGLITHGRQGFLGIRAGNKGGSFIRSDDGIAWEALGPVPPGVDLYSSVEMVSSGDGFVLAADTGQTIRTPGVAGPHLSVWRVAIDGSFRTVFDHAGWQLMSLAADGPVVVASAHDYSPYPELERAFALTSTDGGATFDLSAGWPGMDTATCIGPVAVHDGSAVASGACGIRKAPEIIVANLQQP
jgi:hypothetical protein